MSEVWRERERCNSRVSALCFEEKPHARLPLMHCVETCQWLTGLCLNEPTPFLSTTGDGLLTTIGCVASCSSRCSALPFCCIIGELGSKGDRGDEGLKGASSLSLSHMSTVPSACDEMNRFEWFSLDEYALEMGSHCIDVTCEFVMTPDLLKRV